jgi:hypothetical protein
VTQPPYLLPWVRVLFLIHSITSTRWGSETWPLVKPLVRRALDAAADCAGRMVELDARGQRLRVMLAAVLVKTQAPELKLMHELLDSWPALA